MSPLTLILALPLLTALALVFVPRRHVTVFRRAAQAATLISLVLAAWVFRQFDPDLILLKVMDHGPSLELTQGYLFTQWASWMPSLGIHYHVGVDGLNAGLLLMTALVSFSATCCAREITTREKEFYILLLLMAGGMLGAFASLDLFCMYLFHELALVPTFIMVGVWGHGTQKDYAAFKMTLYLALGSLLALAGILLLHHQVGIGSFDLLELTDTTRGINASVALEAGGQKVAFGLLLFGLGILVGLWPFHTWAPLGYAAAPTATAMMHAGVIKKFGLFVLLRVAVPLLPAGAQYWMPILAVLALANILHCGLVALRQRDFNLLLGNASVAHMGFIFLGIASLNAIGFTGAVLVMVAHGLLSALAFGLSGWIRQQTGTTDMGRLAGLLPALPFVGTLLAMTLFAACGLPGFANFAGEITVFFGAWKEFPVLTLLAVWGALVIGAVLMLRAIRQILHGPPSKKTNLDANGLRRRAPYLLLLLPLLLFGLKPKLITDNLQPVVYRLEPPVEDKPVDLHTRRAR